MSTKWYYHSQIKSDRIETCEYIMVQRMDTGSVQRVLVLFTSFFKVQFSTAQVV